MTSPFLHPSGRPWTAADVNDLHRYSDVDRDVFSHHHTLGNKRTQAAPGDHNSHGILLYVRGTTGVSAGIEIGNVDGTATTPYIDLHSSGNNTDYDSRITASGDRATNADVLGLDAYYVQLGSSARNGGVDFLKQDNTNEGGQANFKGAGAYADVSIDNYQSNLRFLTSGGVPYVKGSDGEIYSKRDNRYVEAEGSTVTKIQAGTTSFSGTAVNVIGPTTITFPEAFTGTPRVVATISGLPAGAGKWIPKHTNKGTTSFDLYVYTGDGLNVTVTSMAVEWIAVGPA